MGTITAAPLLLNDVQNLSLQDLSSYTFNLSSAISTIKNTPGYRFQTLPASDLSKLSPIELNTYIFNLSSLQNNESTVLAYTRAYSDLLSYKASISNSTLQGVSSDSYKVNVLNASLQANISSTQYLYSTFISTTVGLQPTINLAASSIVGFTKELTITDSTIKGNTQIVTQQQEILASDPIYKQLLVTFRELDISSSNLRTALNRASSTLNTSILTSTTQGIVYQRAYTLYADASNQPVKSYKKNMYDLSAAIQSTINAENRLQLESTIAVADLSFAIARSTHYAMASSLASVNLAYSTSQGLFRASQAGGSRKQRGGAAALAADQVNQLRSTVEGIQSAVNAIDICGQENALLLYKLRQTEEISNMFTSTIQYLSTQKVVSETAATAFDISSAAFYNEARTYKAQEMSSTQLYEALDISVGKIQLDLDLLNLRVSSLTGISTTANSTLIGTSTIISNLNAASNASVTRLRFYNTMLNTTSSLSADIESAVVSSPISGVVASSNDIATKQADLQTSYYTLANQNVTLASTDIENTIADQIYLRGKYLYTEALFRDQRYALSNADSSGNAVLIGSIGKYISSCGAFYSTINTMIPLVQNTSTLLVRRAPLSISSDMIQAQITMNQSTIQSKSAFISTLDTDTIETQVSVAFKAVMNVSTTFSSMLVDYSNSFDPSSMEDSLIATTQKYRSSLTVYNSTQSYLESISTLVKSLETDIGGLQATILDLNGQMSDISPEIAVIDTAIHENQKLFSTNYVIASGLMTFVNNGVQSLPPAAREQISNI
jgi:hypothetical protein